eukprot:m.50998 g.50998  ORF g.50998 m.50998 type:complete len:172 (-) comp10923_c0_seq4:428-943(-)
MVKFWESEHTFNHPWSHVSSGHWRKYPNPYNPAVIATDIVEREVTNNGVLNTTRLLSTEFSMPRWVKNMFGSTTINALEHSSVDPSHKKLSLVSKNITFCNLVSIKETITYTEDPQDSSRTIMNQQAEISVPSMTFMEKTLADSIAKNSKKGKEAMEWVINTISAEFTESS